MPIHRKNPLGEARADFTGPCIEGPRRALIPDPEKLRTASDFTQRQNTEE
jgi:hypothetical protein